MSLSMILSTRVQHISSTKISRRIDKLSRVLLRMKGISS